jgi:hypothetical protein
MDKSEYVLTKYDHVLLLNKGFTQEVFGTFWGKDKDGNLWCSDMDQPGEYLMLAQAMPITGGLMCEFSTMTRNRFEELFP